MRRWSLVPPICLAMCAPACADEYADDGVHIQIVAARIWMNERGGKAFRARLTLRVATGSAARRVSGTSISILREPSLHWPPPSVGARLYFIDGPVALSEHDRVYVEAEDAPDDDPRGFSGWDLSPAVACGDLVRVAIGGHVSRGFAQVRVECL